MALQKPTTLESGVTADYWRVAKLHLDFDRDVASISLALYVDADARQAGRQPVRVSDVALPIAPFKTAADPRAAAYTELAKPRPGIHSELQEDGSSVETEVETNWYADAENV